MNSIVVMGRLTRDPEVRYTPNEKVVCQFTLAVDREYRDPVSGQREADFIPVVVWGKTAELCGNSLAKGHRLIVEGRLQIRNFEAKDGTRRWVTEIIARGVTFVERRADVAGPEGQAPQQEQQPTAPAQTSAPAPASAPHQPPQAPRGGYRPQGSYSRPQQASAQAPQGRYNSAPQQGGYQRQAANGAASPFDEEVPF